MNKSHLNVSMTELHLIRHGQTDWNLAGRYQGQSDIPLNAAGLAQARALALSLSGQRFDALYSSDLQRAHQTAQALAQVLNLPIHVRRSLREISMGAWEGRLLAEVSFGYAQNKSPEARAPGGESVAEVAARMALAAAEITRAHPHGRVLLVSHGLALATLVCQANRIPLGQVYEHVPDNARPTIVLWG
jgi:broad specificity phosphatase PhoE